MRALIKMNIPSSKIARSFAEGCKKNMLKAKIQKEGFDILDDFADLATC